MHGWNLPRGVSQHRGGGDADRYSSDNVAEWILELDRGHGIRGMATTHPGWSRRPRLKQEERQQEGLKKMLEKELEWVRQNPKARQAKSKARMQRFEELSSQEFQKRNETNEIYIPPGERLGDLVVEGKGLSKGFGDRLLIDNFSFTLPRGGIVGIIGPNGAGKTTLFRMLTGAEKPTTGRSALGHRSSWPTGPVPPVARCRKSVWQEISGGQDIIKVGNYETSSRAYVGASFQRHAAAAAHRRTLRWRAQPRAPGQGAEVRRQCAPAGRTHHDLDIETLRALEEALLAFPGCAVVISHDRCSSTASPRTSRFRR